MNQKVNPAVGIVIAVAAILIVAFIGMKAMQGNGNNNGGSEDKAVIVKPSNPHDPKFTEHLPAGIAGSGMGGKQ